jgi:hypothetical protein
MEKDFKADDDYFVEDKWKNLRGRDIEVNPKYTRVVNPLRTLI